VCESDHSPQSSAEVKNGGAIPPRLPLVCFYGVILILLCSFIEWWVDNIKMDLREKGWDSMDWIELAQDMNQWRAVVNTVMNLRVP
jgi:hypothetical protein